MRIILNWTEAIISLAVRLVVLFVCHGFGLVVFSSYLHLTATALMLFFGRLIFAFFEARSEKKWLATEHESWQHWSYDDFLGRITTSLFFFLALYVMGWVTSVGKTDGMLIWAYAYIPFISVCFRTKSYFEVVRDE